MKKHYLVYQITNLVNDKIYIGIHGTDDLEDGYMGSGKSIKSAIKKYGIENFIKETLFDFDNPDEMIEKERLLVDRKFVARKDTYNIAWGGRVPKTIDSIPVIDKDGNCFRVHKTDERWVKRELKHIRSGYFSVKDDSGKTCSIKVGDDRFKTGELISIHKEKFLVKDSVGNFFTVNKNNPRYLSGELVSFWTGRKHREETKKKIGKANSIHQKGEGNSQFGTCWIHNEVESKKIKKEELDSFLSEGWIKGRKIKFKES